MSKNAKKSAPLRGGLEVDRTRPDVATGRAPEDSYIFRTNQRPTLNSREKWLEEAVVNKLPIQNAVLGTGLPVRYVMAKYGIDPTANPEQLAELQKLRDERTTR